MEIRRGNRASEYGFSQESDVHTFGAKESDANSLDQISQKSNSLYYASDLNQQEAWDNVNFKYKNLSALNPWQAKVMTDREPFSVINAKLARDEISLKQEGWNTDRSFRDIEIVEELDNSDAWSAVDYSESVWDSSSTAKIQDDNLISADEVKALLEQQNQRHLEIMKKQQQMFQMQVSNHKRNMGNKFAANISPFQDSSNIKESNYSNISNFK